MANYYGTNYTSAYPTSGSAGKYAVGEYNGRVRMLRDAYVFPADVFSASDFIYIGKLPAGARVVGAGMQGPSMGTTGIFDLGTADDPNGFVSGIDLGGQAAVKLGSTEALIGTKYSVETEVIIDCTEATDSAEGDSLQAWILYVLE
jgi:hypothetical protein